MSHTFSPKTHCLASSFDQLLKPRQTILPQAPVLESGCNRKLKFDFEHQLKALIYFHLEEHTSRLHLLQALKEDDYARNTIAPKEGIKNSTFFEASNSRGLEQRMYVFTPSQGVAANILPKKFAGLGGPQRFVRNCSQNRVI